MKKLLLIVLVCAFAGCSNNDDYKPTSDPKEFVFQNLVPNFPFTAAQAFRVQHKSEINKTFMINELIETGMLRVIFYSYSIGANVVRDVSWTAVVGGNLYWVSCWTIEDHAVEYGSSEEEIEQIKFKAKQWEENSGLFWAD